MHGSGLVPLFLGGLMCYVECWCVWCCGEFLEFDWCEARLVLLFAGLECILVLWVGFDVSC